MGDTGVAQFLDRCEPFSREPAPLKNAIDVGSRPYGQSAWNSRPGAVVSASPGPIGGFGANHHLRQSSVERAGDAATGGLSPCNARPVHTDWPISAAKRRPSEV